MRAMVIVATVIAFGTALFWARLFLRRDKFSPEPLRLLITLFIAGGLLTVPAAYIEQSIPSNDLAFAVLVAPVVEETLKLAAIILICSWSRHFNHVIDGAIYGISCGLGFAAVENLLFGLGAGFGVLGARALVGPITHPLYTGVIGLFYARARFERKPLLLPLGLLFGIALHAGWNATPGLLAQTGNDAFAMLFIFVLILYVGLLRRFLRHLDKPEVQRLRTALAIGEVDASPPPLSDQDAAAS